MKSIKHVIHDEDGAALPTVLIVMIIITIFIGAIIAGIYIQNRFIQKNINATESRYEAESGIYQFLSNTSYLNIQNDTSAVIYSNDSSRIIIHARPFGGFLDIVSKTEYKNQKKSIRVLVGEEEPDIFQNAVVLGDSTSELSVTGSTNIIGDILTGQLGVRTTNFKGYPFSGTLEGEQENKGGVVLPVYNMGFLISQIHEVENYFQRVSSSSAINVNEDIFDSALPPGDTLYVFENTTWVNEDSINIPDDITLFVAGNLVLNGNFEFGMFNKIIVRDTLQVGGNILGTHVLLYAGKSLQIGGAVSISCQCISGNDIIVRDEAYLKYPSFLYTEQEYNATASRKNEIIHLRGNSIVDGSILYPVRQNQFSSANFRIKIEEHALVRGGVYSLGQTELTGKVYGSVLSQQFYFYESPTSYINWLKDVEIDHSQRPQEYIVPLGFNDNPKYKVIEWMETKY